MRSYFRHAELQDEFFGGINNDADDENQIASFQIRGLLKLSRWLLTSKDLSSYDGIEFLPSR